MRTVILSPSCEGIPPERVWIETDGLASALSAFTLLQQWIAAHHGPELPAEQDTV